MLHQQRFFQWDWEKKKWKIKLYLQCLKWRFFRTSGWSVDLLYRVLPDDMGLLAKHLDVVDSANNSCSRARSVNSLRPHRTEINTRLDGKTESQACLLKDCEASAQKIDLCFSWSQNADLAASWNRGTNLLGGKASSVKGWANDLKNCSPAAWLCDIPLRIKKAQLIIPQAGTFEQHDGT